MGPKKQHILTLVAVAFIAILICLPGLDFQSGIAQGDHGLNLYAFQQTGSGAVPYRDYYWVNGPLMPYYYGCFFKFFGDSMQSVMVGRSVLIVLASVFCYASLSRVISPLTAFTAAIWYLVFIPRFGHTYSNVGATAVFMPMLYGTFQFFISKKRRYLGVNLFCVFIINLIRLNIGLSLGVATLAAVFLTERGSGKKQGVSNTIFYTSGFALVCLLTAAIYLLFINGLPSYYLNQCFPYSGTNRARSSNIIMTISSYLSYAFGWATRAGGIFSYFSAIVILAVTNFLVMILQRRSKSEYENRCLLVLGVLCLYYVLTMHEFLKSGVFYRLYWASPFVMMAQFILIDMLTRKMSKKTRVFLMVSLLIGCIGVFGARTRYKVRFKEITSKRFLTFSAGRFYGSNTSQWFGVVKETTAFLKKNLRKDERFFAFPYDAIYYYLTETKSPNRMLIFFQHNNIPDQQQREVIASLERHAVRYIVMSNRAYSRETGMGYFGKTHCAILDQYFKDNFKPVVQFGYWSQEPQYMANHATRIFKRVTDEEREVLNLQSSNGLTGS